MSNAVQVAGQLETCFLSGLIEFKTIASCSFRDATCRPGVNDRRVRGDVQPGVRCPFINGNSRGEDYRSIDERETPAYVEYGGRSEV